MMNSGKSDIEESAVKGSGIFNYLEQEKTRSSRVPHALAIAASVVIILAGIQASSVLVGPMLLALFLAVILLVPLRWLQKKGCPHFLAFLVVMICTVALFLGITYFVSKSLTEFIGKIPAYTNRVVAQYNNVNGQLKKWGFFIVEMGKNVEPDEQTLLAAAQDPLPPDQPVVPVPLPQKTPPVVPQPNRTGGIPDGSESSETDEKMDEGEIHQQDADDVPVLPPDKIAAWVGDIEKKEPTLIALTPSVVAYWLTKIMLYVRSMLVGAFLVLIFTIFMLIEAAYFPSKINHAFGADGPINIKHFHRIADDIRRYLFLKTIANLMSGSAAMFVYWMFDVDGWLLWGIIAFFMYYIPNIGGTLAAVIPGILILVSPFGFPGVLIYAVCLVTIECSIAYGIEPRILGHGLRLSTLVIILSLFFWGFLLGPIGLFLAAPLTVVTKIILQAFPETRWISVFLEGSGEKH